ncbi:hypothetical protein p1B10 (plasmid) [Aromatoleum aromaticum EbN1]|uniref:Uncharacterized protein n=1 Tax=Aromatoleum aromaticum (strain DSM 19018 / LMG 30748 / EbN1) TaxID=76114 RepID=Q5NXF5_AROAE|nr:hypothetical protein p1B10 [Aromatoleum aromaticum EbN1]
MLALLGQLTSTPAMRGEHGHACSRSVLHNLQPPRCAGNTRACSMRLEPRSFNPRDARGTRLPTRETRGVSASTPAYTMRGEHLDGDRVRKRDTLQPPRCAGNTPPSRRHTSS